MKVTEIAALSTNAMTAEQRKDHYNRLNAIQCDENGQYGDESVAVARAAMKAMQRQYPAEFELTIGWLTEAEAVELGHENLAAALQAEYEATPKLGFGKQRSHDWVSKAARQDAYMQEQAKLAAAAQ